ncbi:sulfite exporter TauE/SafE family protein [Aliamphritea hakodatensis]|uniref:sulfite exporter TauE/SafE family protein n=1 Tax=Aliamphritea hakodatensis TaxID=2895352 RepID=UPI0022FD994E|nr:sulfite exporter TauE/SafE family protein [Aliamphritea hakodatensis]
MLDEPQMLLIVLLVFLFAGTVKGVVGLGLPTISLALILLVSDLPTAMALLLVPSFVTNVWQALSTGNGEAGQTLRVWRRVWPFMLPATCLVWLGGQVLATVDFSYLTRLLGVLLVLYSITGLAGLRFDINRLAAGWHSPLAILVGSVNGVLTGMTGSFTVPGVMYLQALNLSRDELMQAMGMLFSLSSLGLAVTLQGNGMLTAEHGLMSLSGLLPAMAGMFIGQKIRQGLSAEAFRKALFIALLLLGLYILL